jgi:5-oxoprolinase (ATP-hydrolysing)
MSGAWHICVDRGGTFTDVVARGPGGRVHVRKVLALGTVEQAALELVEALDPGATIASIRVGTTVATNALLTGEGARTALVVTRGFGDLLRIGHQSRSDIFQLFPVRDRLPDLHSHVLEVDERILADGSVDTELDEAGLLGGLARLAEQGVESLAIALVHGYLYPAHEQRIEELARGLGFRSSVSHRILAEAGLVGRAATTVVDAFLAPVVEDYVAAVAGVIPSGTQLLFLKSSGGLCSGLSLRAVDAVLSGPAGGVVACAALATDLGLPAVLGLDMGGTSTDVCRWAGELERRRELAVAGRTLRSPGLDVVTVAAGGGSLLSVRDGRFQVGPGSAGAAPGPACYGRGGPATITDANLVLGRIQPDLFPASFGVDGTSPIDEGAARLALEAACPGGVVDEVAAGFVAVANERMAAATAEISVARGHDPRHHALIAFGGAAGQHACAIAARLDIREVIVHPMAGVLSAQGISRAVLRELRCAPVMEPWAEDLAERWAGRIEALVQDARAELLSSGADARRLQQRLRWSLRYQGSDTELLATDALQFEAHHRLLFGFARPAQPIEVLQLQLEIWEAEIRGPSVQAPPAAVLLSTDDGFELRDVGFVDSEGCVERLATPLIRRTELQPGHSLVGPALISSETTTVVVDPGWRLLVGAGGELRLTAPPEQDGRTERDARSEAGEAIHPVRLELAHRRFQSIVTRMGELLRRVAWSTNIKERLDFSCALFDGDGMLVSNAPHIPVHLGAMGETVRHLVDVLGDELAEGRSWAVNDPSRGGSHLPDITVITPLFLGTSSPVAFVACRAHHADVGGITPGSMPPFSRSLEEEGVVLDGVLLVEDGQWQERRIMDLLCAGAYPARRPEVCIADLQAQVAANTLGCQLVEQLAGRGGLGPLQSDMRSIQANGAQAVQNWLATLPAAERSFAGQLDDGTAICVAIRPGFDAASGRYRLEIDFSGTGPAVGNLGTPSAVTRAAVLYVVRSLLGREIPLNDGCMRDIDIILPAGSLLDPPAGAAVVGGNVETSQRIVDVLLAALGVSAAAQGTMNNLCFGDASFAYYETLCGGSGAGPTDRGDDAVHSHMTNTRITDAEVLERRYPVILREFSVRTGSGGAGRQRGGDGARRVLQFRGPVQVSLLAQRRSTAPFGLAGGEAGAMGRTTLVAAGGESEEELGGSFSRDLAMGDVLVLETPGGGGYGIAEGAATPTTTGE